MVNRALCSETWSASPPGIMAGKQGSGFSRMRVMVWCLNASRGLQDGSTQDIHSLPGHREMDWKPSSGFTLLCRSNETQLRCMTCPSISFMDAQEASVSYQLCFQEVLVVSFLLPTVCLGTGRQPELLFLLKVSRRNF